MPRASSKTRPETTSSKKPPSPRARRSVKAEPHSKLDLVAVFAANVRLVRLNRELSQELLAHLSGIDRTYVSAVETGRRNVSLRTIQRIAEALDVDVRMLLDPGLSADPQFAA